MMKRVAVLLYGVMAYLMFHVIFLYLIGFIGNILVPKAIDGPLRVPLWQALLTNMMLIGLFAVQHSVMARSWFKKWWTRFVPAPIERSTYLVFTFIALALLFLGWQPLGGIVWRVEQPILIGILWGFYALGWLLVVWSSFEINHFDLFGLRQVWLYFRGKPYTPLAFGTPFLYRWVRHPLYLGLLISFWAGPTMSITRLFFAVFLTVYVLSAIQWEEKELRDYFGDVYRNYMKHVPMILPFRKKRKPKSEIKYDTVLKGGE